MAVQKIQRAVFRRLKKLPALPALLKKNCIWKNRHDFYLPVEAFGCSKKNYNLQKSFSFSKNYKISIIVPLYNTPERDLKEMIGSVLFQTYENWELCLSDGSDENHSYIEKVCREIAEKDNRIKYKKLADNGGISKNSNECFKMVTGDYIALLDHDDLLHPCALFEVIRSINENNADFIYTDSAIFNSPGIAEIINTDFKPDFSPDYFSSINYICHFSVFKTDLTAETGLFDSNTDGAQDFDLFLRLTEKAKSVVHVPKCLYYWRASNTSTANGIQVKQYAIEAGKLALINHLKRCNIQADVSCDRNFLYRINYVLKKQFLVSIIIINTDEQRTKECIDSIKKMSAYQNYEIIILELESEHDFSDNKIKQIKVQSLKNIPALYNLAAKNAQGDFLLFLSCNTTIMSEKWIEEMLMFAQRDDTGAVGGKLYKNNKIYNAGIIFGINGLIGYSHRNRPANDNGYEFRVVTVQNLSAVTAECMMVSKKIYQELNGFDEKFTNACYDIDFCIRLRERKYLIVWTPFSELTYYKTKIPSGAIKTEKQLLKQKWNNVFTKRDTFYNPNLTLKNDSFAVTGTVFPDAEIPD